MDCIDYRLHDPRDERLVSEQCGAAGHLADLARRATHVQVDDLGPALDVVARRVGQDRGIGAHQLHRHRRSLAVMIEPARRLAAGTHARIGRNHFAHRISRTQPAAQLAEWPVRDSRHRRSEYAVCQLEGADAHLEMGAATKKT